MISILQFHEFRPLSQDTSCHFYEVKSPKFPLYMLEYWYYTTTVVVPQWVESLHRSNTVSLTVFSPGKRLLFLFIFSVSNCTMYMFCIGSFCCSKQGHFAERYFPILTITGPYNTRRKFLPKYFGKKISFFLLRNLSSVLSDPSVYVRMKRHKGTRPIILLFPFSKTCVRQLKRLTIFNFRTMIYFKSPVSLFYNQIASLFFFLLLNTNIFSSVLYTRCYIEVMKEKLS